MNRKSIGQVCCGTFSSGKAQDICFEIGMTIANQVGHVGLSFVMSRGMILFRGCAGDLPVYSRRLSCYRVLFDVAISFCYSARSLWKQMCLSLVSKSMQSSVCIGHCFIKSSDHLLWLTAHTRASPSTLPKIHLSFPPVLPQPLLLPGTSSHQHWVSTHPRSHLQPFHQPPQR